MSDEVAGPAPENSGNAEAFPSAPQAQDNTPPVEPPPAPQAPGYQQPYANPGYQQAQDPAWQQAAFQAASGSVQLNYWLSVFFTWIPALIFYLTERGKNPLADEYHRQNLNFSLLRTIVSVGFFIPYLNILVGIAALGLFIIHIMAAAGAQASFNQGQPVKFAFNVDIIK